MEKEKLIEFVSEFWEIETQKIHDSLPLDDKHLNDHSSIRFYRFIAAIESNFNVEVKEINKIRTFIDLVNSITDEK